VTEPFASRVEAKKKNRKKTDRTALSDTIDRGSKWRPC
jgi:hypothetical protein